MGLLSEGTPLEWEKSKRYLQHVRENGIAQFLHVYAQLKERHGDKFLWGDEVECLLLTVDADAKTTRLCLRAPELIALLNKSAEQLASQDEAFEVHAKFLPEYGKFQIEGTPGGPYGGTTADLRLVEANMRLRREMVAGLLRENERVVTLGSYPMMGVDVFTEPAMKPGGPVTTSTYIPDGVISPHPRFATLTRNIRTRRGKKVDIRIPLFQDKNTAATFGPSSDEAKVAAAEPDVERPIDVSKEIHMDAMAFGMGCNCLQVTFQARSINEARHLYDHLAVLTPVLLALTASTPFFKGLVSDNDVRWTVISQSVDDRTPAERGVSNSHSSSNDDDINSNNDNDEEVKDQFAVDPHHNSPQKPARRIAKSRYDSIDVFLSLESNMKGQYNDIATEYDETFFKQMTDAGVDELLAKHVAHLFIRDPLVIYEESVEQDNTASTDHFENIQSTNWQTVRFKPPPPKSTTGWRVEFRSMELQMTDFENAAFTVFIALLSRAILYYDLNLYIPVSQVDENMRRAHRNDAVRTQTFVTRRNIHSCKDDTEDKYVEMTMADIVMGKDTDYPGLVPLVKSYLDAIKCDKQTREVVDRYLKLIELRATGKLLTTAQWMRQFVDHHPDYKHDSRLSQSIVYDLVEVAHAVSWGTCLAPGLLPDFYLDAVKAEAHGKAAVLNVEDPIDCAQIKTLFAKYAPSSDDGDGNSSNNTSSKQ